MANICGRKKWTAMKTILKHLSLIVAVIALNFIIQQSLMNKTVEWGLIKLALTFNTGFIFGLYNEASSFVRIVLTSITMGLLTLIACYFYEFLHSSLQRLRWGMTLTLAGVIGNGLEKLIYGYVWDYINLNLPFFQKFTFNLNDLLQIFGLLILMIEVFSKQDIIWFPQVTQKRKATIIYREIQLPILFKISGLIFIGSLTQAILTVALLFPQLKRGSQDTQLIFFLCIFLLNLAILPLLAKYLLKELLRCLGPVYALERYLKNEELQERELKFRKTDHLQSLEVAFNEFVRKKKR
jgi:lipoprotein signal peptidase